MNRARRNGPAEFDTVVDRIAGALARRGIGKRDRLSWGKAPNSREFVIAYFALARLGAISVPVNLILRAPR